VIAQPKIPPSVSAVADPLLLDKQLENLIEACRCGDDALLESYLDRFDGELCGLCSHQAVFNRSCPLKALLPLAAAAVELHKKEELALADALAWDDAEMPESD
jgi:hypothetical protein